MKINLDRSLYLDLELTCGQLATEEERQIIQVGIVEIDLNNLERLRSDSFFVRPQGYFTITDFCTNLTGITRKQVMLGHPLQEVMNRIAKNYSTKNLMCFSWGNDKLALDNECNNPFVHMVDLSWFFNLKNPNQPRSSLKNAMDYFGLEFEGRMHDAKFDAIATSQIHIEMIKRFRDECPI